MNSAEIYSGLGPCYWQLLPVTFQRVMQHVTAIAQTSSAIPSIPDLHTAECLFRKPQLSCLHSKCLRSVTNRTRVTGEASVLFCTSGNSLGSYANIWECLLLVTHVFFLYLLIFYQKCSDINKRIESGKRLMTNRATTSFVQEAST